MNVYGGLSKEGSVGEGRGKGKDTEGWRCSKYATCIYMKKHNEAHQRMFEKGVSGWWKEGNGNIIEDELVQSTLYACVKFSQWIPPYC
jgi:hypothetical protein